MKRINILLLLFIALFAFSACHTTQPDIPNYKQYGYAVDSIEILNQWAKAGDKTVLPNTPDQTVTDFERNEYGDLSHMIDKIAQSGYLITRSGDGEPVPISMCQIYEVNNIHDIFLRFEYQLDDQVVALPCFITYIPEADMDLARSSPAECILKVRNLQLSSADNPRIADGDMIVLQEQTISISGSPVQALTMEYLNSDMAGKYGVVFFIYQDMIIQLQRPYSDETIPYVLENIILDTYRITGE